MEKKVILVFGASGCLGGCIVHKLLEKDEIAVAHSFRSEEKIKALIDEYGDDNSFQAVHADITDSEQVKQVINQVVEKYGRLDAVINCAGIIRDNLLLFMSDEEWKEVIDVNLTGTFNITKHAVKTMLKQRKKGVIIHVSSGVGVSGNVGQANYAASKAGMIGFTKSVSMEYEKKNIFIRCAVVGALSGGMANDALSKGVSESDKIMPYEEFADKVIKLIEEQGNTSIIDYESGM